MLWANVVMSCIDLHGKIHGQITVAAMLALGAGGPLRSPGR
jgi:hypothetical protein